MAAENNSSVSAVLPAGSGGLVLVVGILYLAKAVIVPLALDRVIHLCPPIQSSVWSAQRSRPVPAVLVTVILTFAVCGTTGWGVGIQVNKLAQELPDNKEKIQKKIADLRGSGEARSHGSCR